MSHMSNEFQYVFPVSVYICLLCSPSNHTADQRKDIYIYIAQEKKVNLNSNNPNHEVYNIIRMKIIIGYNEGKMYGFCLCITWKYY